MCFEKNMSGSRQVGIFRVAHGGAGGDLTKFTFERLSATAAATVNGATPSPNTPVTLENGSQLSFGPTGVAGERGAAECTPKTANSSSILLRTFSPL